ncbi:transporter [Brevundimonas diminuta]|uniref:transporter n=1 Tax=Brevundimonas diminuta TaxID=293 RepID=UPI0022AE9FB7|nr:transporter [Brevundimonas diminuta]MCZ4109267.1 transporter [Brevundimonas diminuta]
MSPHRQPSRPRPPLSPHQSPRRAGSALRLIGASVAVAALLAPGAALAQDEELAARVARLEALVIEQQRRIEAQEALLNERAAMAPPSVDPRWQVQTDASGRAVFADRALNQLRAGQQVASTIAPNGPAQPTLPPSEAPPPPAPEVRREQLAAIPEGIAVLSQPGKFTLDVSTEYTRSSANRLVFRGIEIVPGVQIGVIEANEADRDTGVVTLAGKYGIGPRMEAELRVPYVWRNDTITTVQQRDEAVTRTIDLSGDGVGDVEAALRYQINGGERGRPIFIAGLRVKSDTGEGPFDIDRDEFGIATRLATGSGFWGVEPSISFLYPSDPAVIFGSLSYFAHLPRDINKTEGEIRIGEVDPGDAIGLSIGFGFSLNPRFSFSLGYKHNYIRPTTSELNDITEKSDALQVGALQFGMSYLLNDRYSLNGNFEFGVTEDAPDMRFILRLPIVF